MSSVIICWAPFITKLAYRPIMDHSVNAEHTKLSVISEAKSKFRTELGMIIFFCILLHTCIPLFGKQSINK